MPTRSNGLHEIVFAVFFATVAAVTEFYPGGYSLRFLLGLLAIFVLNLAYFLYRKRRETDKSLVRAYLTFNSLAIFLVVTASRGRESPYWVAFLLPVLAAAVSDKASPWPFVALDGAFLATLYGIHVDAYDVVEWAMKVSTLTFAAAVTRRTYLNEHSLRSALEEKRLHLEYLALKMLQEQRPIQTEGDLRDQVERRLRLLENPLSVLQDSARLVEAAAPEALADVKRIEACHRLIKSLTQDLFDILYHDEFWIEKIAFEEVYRKVLHDLRYPLAVKEVRFLETIEPELPTLPISRSHIEQLLHTIFGRAVLAAAHRDLFEIQVRMAGLSEEPYLEVMIVHPGLSDVFSLNHLRGISERHGGWLQLDYLTRAVRYTLALPLRQGAKLNPAS
jgi:hypothetical protein